MTIPTAFHIFQPILTALTLCLLFKWVLPEESLLQSGKCLIRDSLFSPRGRWGLAAVLIFAVAGSVQNAVDPWFTKLAVSLHGIEDFSQFIYQIEGSLTSKLQAFAPSPLIAFFLFVYVCLFPAVYALFFLVFRSKNNSVQLEVTIRSLLLNYIFALPFFIFFSVRETWYADLGDVVKARSLLSDLSPEIEPLFRTARGVENNFPSLHSSIAMTALLIANQSEIARLKIVARVSAVLVMFSTLYLGFHWVTDMVAGCLLAWVCVKLASRQANSSEPEPSPEEPSS
jgi:membrane-associated phospholipid phosphatase